MKIIFQCPRCNKTVDKFVVGRHKTCPYCNYAFRLGALERLELLNGSFVEWGKEIHLSEQFPGSEEYKKKLLIASNRTSLNDAVVTGEFEFNESESHFALGIFDYQFLMGSIGVVVGEKIKLLFKKAETSKLPVVLFCASGGARMQESPYSLIQMEKMSYYASEFKKNGGYLINILCDPCMGGELASIASLGNINVAEPKAQIGFAGLKVIEKTIGEKVSIEQQLAETVYSEGFLDDIVSRGQINEWLERVIKIVIQR